MPTAASTRRDASHGDRASAVRRRAASLALTVVAAAVIIACDAATDDEPTTADYTDEMTAICADTAARLDELPSPPADISIADFATEAATALENEAELSRLVAVPDDLSDDHRAFVANTEEQAEAWRSLASTAPDDSAELNALSERITQLLLGRDDLSAEMGLDGCRRADT